MELLGPKVICSGRMGGRAGEQPARHPHPDDFLELAAYFMILSTRWSLHLPGTLGVVPQNLAGVRIARKAQEPLWRRGSPATGPWCHCARKRARGLVC